MGDLIDAPGFGKREEGRGKKDECCTYITTEGLMEWLEYHAV
jgi:hypothetical protein